MLVAILAGDHDRDALESSLDAWICGKPLVWGQLWAHK